MKRLVLLSLGLMLTTVAYVGCLPSDSTTGTPGTAGAGTPGSAGNGQTGGTTGAAGDNGNPGSAGNGSAGSSNPGDAGTTGGSTSPGAGGDIGGTAGPGAAGNGAAGNGSAGNGSAGSGTAGRGGMGGTGGTAGSGTAGRGGTGGGNAGTGGTAARGGTGGSAAGTGGSAAGTGGSAGGTTGTGGSGNPVCDSIKQQLDGFEYLLACGPTQNYSPLVCQNPAGTCPAGSEYLVRGHQNMDRKLTIAGTSAQSCTITLHIQGIVEPKHYNRCTTYFGAADEGFAQGPANGGATSGCYPSTSGDYNVYMMHVSDSATLLGTTLSGTRYFWNAINQTEAHFSYKIDYTTPSITIKGGQTLWMLANDSNCSAIKNCSNTSMDGTTATSGRCDAINFTGLTTSPGAAITQPYNGQFIVLHVASAQ